MGSGPVVLPHQPAHTVQSEGGPAGLGRGAEDGAVQVLPGGSRVGPVSSQDLLLR